MKHILAILALAGVFVSQPANAQIDQSPENWGNSGTIPSGSPHFKYPPTVTEPVPVPIPPVKYDHEYRGGQVIVTRWHDYDMVRQICKGDPTAIACAYPVSNAKTGEQISCLILLVDQI
jgi:hypothetical protein